MTQYWLIYVDQATAGEQDAVTEIVKTHSDEWWHQFEQLWIVKGHASDYWKVLIKPVLVGNPRSGVMVFGLPAPQTQPLSYSGPEYHRKMEWLHRLFRFGEYPGGAPEGEEKSPQLPPPTAAP